MTVTRVPASNPVTSDLPVHWLVAGRNGAASFIACGAAVAGSRFLHLPFEATCPDCATVVIRRRCYEPDPAATGLGLCCMRDLVDGAEHEGPHDWEADDVAEMTSLRAQVQRQAAESYAASAELDRLSRLAVEESRHADLAVPPNLGGTEEDTPSGRLPVRTPGAALHQVLAEEAEERTDGDAWPALEEEREVIETWTA